MAERSDGTYTKKDLLAYAQSERSRFESRLRDFVEIPSISPSPDHKAECARAAAFGAGLIEEMGGEARIIPTPGNPIVHGRFHGDDRWPTVTVYNHLDVQPAERSDGWNTEPFVFTPRGDRYFGRGTTDDKGPALTALWGAKYAIASGAQVNIQLLWEAEEEIGSPNFEKTIRAERESLRTGSVVVSDTIWVSRKTPAQPAGLRGLQGFRFSLETGQSDEHSGVTGGAARNPVAELCQLVAECVDGKSGKVKIPGFYADVVPPTRQELADLRSSGFTIAGFKKDHHFKSLRTDNALEAMKRIWCMPTFEVHGIAGGYQGPGIKTVVPPRATAIISCRLVPNMNEKKIVKLVRDFVKKKNPSVKVEPEHGLPAYRGKTTGPLAEAMKGAMRFAFGKEPVFVREGGSIGAVLSMERVLKVPISFLGLSLPEHGYHAPNENFDWGQAKGGMLAFADYFRRIGEQG